MRYRVYIQFVVILILTLALYLNEIKKDSLVKLDKIYTKGAIKLMSLWRW